MTDSELKAFARENAPALAAPIARLVEQVIAKGIQGHLHHAAELQLRINDLEAAAERYRKLSAASEEDQAFWCALAKQKDKDVFLDGGYDAIRAAASLQETKQ